MQVAVVTGPGRVGAALLAELIGRNHAVTLGWTDRLPGPPLPGTRVVLDCLHRREELADAFAGSEIVVSALDPNWDDPDLYDAYLAAARTVLAVARETAVPRLFWIGGAGTLQAAPGVSLADTPEFPRRFRPVAFAAREVLRLLTAQAEVEWTMLAPPIHVDDGARTALYRVARDSPVYGAGGESHISAADLAVAAVDEVERPRHPRERFTVGY